MLGMRFDKLAENRKRKSRNSNVTLYLCSAIDEYFLGSFICFSVRSRVVVVVVVLLFVSRVMSSGLFPFRINFCNCEYF